MTLYQTCIQMDILMQKYLQSPICMFRNPFQTLGSWESSSFLPLSLYTIGHCQYLQRKLQRKTICFLRMPVRVIRTRLKISWTWMHSTLQRLAMILRLMPALYWKKNRGRISALLKTSIVLTHTIICSYTKLITAAFLCRPPKHL